MKRLNFPQIQQYQNLLNHIIFCTILFLLKKLYFEFLPSKKLYSSLSKLFHPPQLHNLVRLDFALFQFLQCYLISTIYTILLMPICQQKQLEKIISFQLLSLIFFLKILSKNILGYYPNQNLINIRNTKNQNFHLCLVYLS